MQLRHVMELVGRLRRPEAPYRADAVRRLLRLPQHVLRPEVRAAVVVAMDDPDPRVRRVVAALVAQQWWTQRPAQVPPYDDFAMRQLLEDTGAQVRMSAAAMMAFGGDLRAVPVLVATVRGADTQLRPYAARMVDALLKRVADHERVVVVGQVLPVLLDALKDPSMSERWTVVRALGACRDRRVVAALATAAREPGLHWVAFDSLAGIGGPDVLGPILDGLADPSAAVWAARALGTLGDRAAVPTLIRVGLANPAGDARAAAARALGRLRTREAVPALVDRLTDSDANVAAQAARALGRLGDPRARGPLQACLSDDRRVTSHHRDRGEPGPWLELVRDYAAHALTTLDRN